MPCELQAQAEGGELADPTRRTGAEPAADGQLAEGEAVAGDDHVARVLAQRHGGQRDAVGGRGRQVLERVDGEVDVAVEERVAQGADEDPGAAQLGERGGAAVALGRDLDELDLAAEVRLDQLGDEPGLGGGQGGGAGAEAERTGSRGAHGLSLRSRVMASTASGSRRKSSASAAV